MHLDWVAGTQGNMVDASNVGNPSVIALRDQFHADVVLLIVANAFVLGPQTNLRVELCGLAYNQYDRSRTNGVNPGTPFEPFAYSVVKFDCAIGFQDFTHEMGNLLGLDHDPKGSPTTQASATAPEVTCPGSYAHRDGRNMNLDFRFRTALAGSRRGLQSSANGPFECLDMLASNCLGVPVFSNPSLEWSISNGIQPAGTTPGAPRLGVVNGVTGATLDANNWDTFRKMAPLVARYRDDPIELFRDSFEL